MNNPQSHSRRRRHVTTIGAACAVAAAVVAGLAVATPAQAAAGSANPLVTVPGSAAPRFVDAHRAGGVAADRMMTVAVSLKLHNTAQLAAFDKAVSTPGSAIYGHYMTPAQFVTDFGPTTADVASVRQFLTSAGLKVTDVSGNRQVVDARGTASAVAAAFHTSLSTYTEGTSHYIANDSAVSLPAGVSGVVQGVSGLSTRAVEHPLLAQSTNAVAPHADAGPVGGFSPSQYDSAYRLSSTSANGTGVTVALWEFDGYNTADLNTYNSQYGLSGPAVTTVSVDGADFDSSPGSGEIEVELDSEVVRGVAPSATQLIYEAPNSDQGQIDMANQIASQDRVSVVSNSWGGCEQDSTSSSITSTNNAMSQLVAEGISMYSASGDDGSRDCTQTQSGSGVKAVDFPGSSPNGTAAGGTTLTLTSSNTYSSEKAWSDSGGGVSTIFARPSWQTGTQADRTVPDVSSDADPNSGFSVFSGGSWTEVGGTSAAAPLWSGFTALFNQRAAAASHANLGFGNPAFYAILGGSSYNTDFHDIKTGSNQDFSAGTGYDEVTGIGSPIADALITGLLGTGTGTGGNTVTVTNPGNQSTTTGSSVNLTVSASDSGGAALTFGATGLPTGLSISSAGVITGTASTAGTFSVTVTATDSTGASGSASFTWTVTSSSGCSSPGQKLGNPGFESGNTVWASTAGVIGQNGPSEPAHSGSWDAWLDGYGTTHTDTISQSVTIPTGCSATLSFWLHIDTAETTRSTAFDTLTVKLGSTTVATFSNLNAASGYTQHTFNVSSLAGQTVKLLFTGSEDSSLQTSFVVDDTALTTS